ncbi:MAG: phosphotransferase [Acidimicrobiia bacterium]|nr:phosphotransferase [Acidimicrobiia bacterium]
MTSTPGPTNLLEAIRATAEQPTLEWARPAIPLTGGFWAQMWHVRLATDCPGLGGELVARVMPEPDVAARETAVQAHLARSGYPTPIVRLAAPPGPHLGRAWMLMDHAPGQPLLTGLSGAAALARLPRIARALPDQLAQHAAALHVVDPAPLCDAIDGTDLLIPLRERAVAIDRPDLISLADHLDDSRPPPGRVVLCHGDLHPFNILTDPDGDTVLDWSATRIADPAYDIAYTRLLLVHTPLSAPRPLRAAIAAAGRVLAHRFTATYNRTASVPVDPDQLAWYTDLHALRVVTEVASWQANGELAKHPGHPFLTLSPALTTRLRAHLDRRPR